MGNRVKNTLSNEKDTDRMLLVLRTLIYVAGSKPPTLEALCKITMQVGVRHNITQDEINRVLDTKLIDIFNQGV